MASCNVLSVDYGAGSGRGVVCAFDGDTLSLKEVHRFANIPVQLLTGLYWDTLDLYKQLLHCLHKAHRLGIPVSSVGIDGWSQDFGILDRGGNLLGLPHHYRDSRTSNLQDQIYERTPAYDLFQLT